VRGVRKPRQRLQLRGIKDRLFGVQSKKQENLLKLLALHAKSVSLESLLHLQCRASFVASRAPPPLYVIFVPSPPSYGRQHAHAIYCNIVYVDNFDGTR